MHPLIKLLEGVVCSRQMDSDFRQRLLRLPASCWALECYGVKFESTFGKDEGCSQPRDGTSLRGLVMDRVLESVLYASMEAYALGLYVVMSHPAQSCQHPKASCRA